MTAPTPISEDSIIAASDPSAVQPLPSTATADLPDNAYIDVNEQLAVAKESLKELKIKAKELKEAGEPIPP